jgi:dynein heavy chain 1
MVSHFIVCCVLLLLCAADLNNAKPALLEAAAAVSSIKRDQLAQVTNLPNPPPLVKLAVEPVLMMLNEKVDTWDNMRKAMKKPTFTQQILGFNIDGLNEKTRERVSTFLKNPDFNYEAVNKASKACGPLVKWVEATLNFARIKNSVEPLTK